MSTNPEPMNVAKQSCSDMDWPKDFDFDLDQFLMNDARLEKIPMSTMKSDHVVPSQQGNQYRSSMSVFSPSSPLGSDHSDLFPTENFPTNDVFDILPEELYNPPTTTTTTATTTEFLATPRKVLTEQNNNGSKSSSTVTVESEASFPQNPVSQKSSSKPAESSPKFKRHSAVKAEKNLREIAATLDQVGRIEKKGSPRKVEKKKSLPIEHSPSSVFSANEVEEEKLAKMEKNRQSARDCRKRKKAYIQGLEKRVQTLEQELSIALDEIRILRERLQCMRSSK